MTQTSSRTPPSLWSLLIVATLSAISIVVGGVVSIRSCGEDVVNSPRRPTSSSFISGIAALVTGRPMKPRFRELESSGDEPPQWAIFEQRTTASWIINKLVDEGEAHFVFVCSPRDDSPPEEIDDVVLCRHSASGAPREGSKISNIEDCSDGSLDGPCIMLSFFGQSQDPSPRDLRKSCLSEARDRINWNLLHEDGLK